MNCYFLVEGDETEMNFYPQLICYLKPDYTQIYSVKDFTNNNFYMFSGGGYPNIFNKLKSALLEIENFNKSNKYAKIKIDVLVLVVDSDRYETYDRAMQAVTNRINNLMELKKKAKVSIKVIIQHRCIESWFLGNTDLFPTTYDNTFREYVDYYNVKINDPEEMGSPNSQSKGQYAYSYFVEMLSQNKLIYAKSKKGSEIIKSTDFIVGLYNRANSTPHLRTFMKAYNLIKSL